MFDKKALDKWTDATTMRSALAGLINLIEEDGGLVMLMDEGVESLYLNSDFEDGFGQDWPELARVYLQACKLLLHEPVIQVVDASDLEDEDDEEVERQLLSEESADEELLALISGDKDGET
jgi:PHD/YefM family antitoxin component YafN of YafNO toxin-antitoxin module